jgi:hypothetical protein
MKKLTYVMKRNYSIIQHESRPWIRGANNLKLAEATMGRGLGCSEEVWWR